MAKHKGIYSCGHEGEITLTGSAKYRESSAEYYFSQPCPACRKAERMAKLEAESAEAKKLDREMELPELTGTEAQVTWAVTLRQEFIAAIQQKIDRFSEQLPVAAAAGASPEKIEKAKAEIVLVAETLEHVLKNKTRAKYYIDNRVRTAVEVIADEMSNYTELKRNAERREEEQQILADDYATIAPDELKHTGMVIIREEENIISAEYIKDEKFISIVKNHRFLWDGQVWKRKITELCGSINDRAAELANALLLSGYAVKLPKEIKEMAVNADYAQEINTWVMYNSANECLEIKSFRRDDNMYSRARRISGGKWNRGTRSILVPIQYYAEVEDFAATTDDCEISRNACEKIQEYKNMLKNMERVTPAEHIAEAKEDALDIILKSDDAVIDDLRDDI